MCALNNNLYERLAIEDADNFLRQSVFECANEDCDSHKKYEKRCRKPNGLKLSNS